MSKNIEYYKCIVDKDFEKYERIREDKDFQIDSIVIALFNSDIELLKDFKNKTEIFYREYNEFRKERIVSSPENFIKYSNSYGYIKLGLDYITKHFEKIKNLYKNTCPRCTSIIKPYGHALIDRSNTIYACGTRFSGVWSHEKTSYTVQCYKISLNE